MTSVIKQLMDDYNKVRGQFREKQKQCFHAVFAQFFQDNPTVKSIIWNQYTPYFNDGDECIFGVGDMYFSLTVERLNEIDNSHAASYGDEEGWYPGYFSNDEKDKPIKDTIDKFEEFRTEVNRLDNDVFKELFGDHVMVMATREGFETDEYSHD